MVCSGPVLNNLEGEHNQSYSLDIQQPSRLYHSLEPSKRLIVKSSFSIYSEIDNHLCDLSF